MFLEVNPCFQKAHVFCISDLQPAADPYSVVCTIQLEATMLPVFSIGFQLEATMLPVFPIYLFRKPLSNFIYLCFAESGGGVP